MLPSSPFISKSQQSLQRNERQSHLMTSPIFTAAGEKDFPSFATGDGSSICISAAKDWPPPVTNEEEEESMDYNFEFSFSADQGREGISNKISLGQIFPVHSRDFLDSDSLTCTPEAVQLPVRQLLMEERNTTSRSSTSVDDTDGIFPNKFCLWEPRSVPPSPNRWKKSKSTGSSSRRWRLRDLVFGRSHSDGKNKFDYLGPEGRNGREGIKNGKKKEKNLTEIDVATAHRLQYAKSSVGGWRSFLPYKQYIIGFFGQAHHPF